MVGECGLSQWTDKNVISSRERFKVSRTRNWGDLLIKKRRYSGEVWKG